MNTEDIILRLRAVKPIIVSRYKVREISLFGSFARNEQNISSDVDVLVEFDDKADLLDWIGLGFYLEEILQRRVDVIPKRALRKELQESVLRERIVL